MVLSDCKPKLLTIITASNRPHNMHGFLENLLETVSDYNCLEVLAKIDVGDEVMSTLMQEAVMKYPFSIRYIQTPRLDGYYTLHHGYQSLLDISSPETYFIFPVNEEVRFKTMHWDKILSKYVNFYEDDFFRLKISRLKYRNYYNVQECGPTPENYPFVTRKWMELAGGIGDCWGPDGWHQYIDYHLGLTEGIDGRAGIFRSVPIQDILIGGEEAGKEISPKQMKIRAHRIFQEWWRMYRTEAQQEFRKIATRMNAYVWAKNKKLNSFEIVDHPNQAKFCLIDKQTNEIKHHFDYYLSPFLIKLDNFRYLVKVARSNSIGHLTAFIHSSYGPKVGVKKYINFLLRYCLVLISVLLSFVTVDDESFPKKYYLRQFLRIKTISKHLARKIINTWMIGRADNSKMRLKYLVDCLKKIKSPKKISDKVWSLIRGNQHVCSRLARKFFKIIFDTLFRVLNVFRKSKTRLIYIYKKVLDRIYYPNPLR